MKAGYGSFYEGLPLVKSDFCTLPAISLSKDLNISDEFRQKVDANLERLFGRKPAMLYMNGVYVAHPDIIRAFKEGDLI